MTKKQPSGMTGFVLIWIGQFFSMLGSGMTIFAISIWAWEKTGQATALGWAAFFGFGPTVLLSPFAGAIVDRANRKLVMILADVAAGMSTTVLLVLFLSGRLEIWHIYVTNAFAGAFAAFQFPAYSAAVTTLIEKKHYARASGMLALADSTSGIIAPIVASALFGFIGVGGIMAIDLVTMSLAIVSLLLVFIPPPTVTAEGAASRGSFLQEAGFGFKYIFRKPSLLGLQLTFFLVNLTGTSIFVLLSPMILARTGDEKLLGLVQSIGSIGGVVGGLLMTTWGGPKRRVNGVLLGMASISFFEGIMGMGQVVYVWAAANFMTAMILPILNGSNQAIWQSKVAPDVQGRVFSVRRLIAQITAPVAMLAAGPLADRVFEPAMAEGGVLTPLFGPLVGTGPGAGMGVMMLVFSALGIMVGFGGYAVPAIRNAETILPDHDELTATTAEGAEKRQQQLQELLQQRADLANVPHSAKRQSELREVSRKIRNLGRQTAVKE